jgi:hypothetical protein
MKAKGREGGGERKVDDKKVHVVVVVSWALDLQLESLLLLVVIRI